MTDWGVHLINIALWAMGPEWPRAVVASGGKYVLKDNSETPDTQITVYDFPSYTLIWEHQVGCGLGPDRREHGVVFTGTEATLIVDTSGWEIIAGAEEAHGGGGDEAPGAGGREGARGARGRFPGVHAHAAARRWRTWISATTFPPSRTWATSRCARAAASNGTAKPGAWWGTKRPTGF